ncbi:glucokinase [Janthinobacterium agaricidamnosum]|uniref:Glucokinase n=1 Tax=Janthinobacterium agaricidamnosum NBRC 102515 = DSM 9628 TaxID=1349767 RepID=W0VBB6_9BURK|nr:glucokinase [Janthinobacterium agaricidamnosum]CDG84905.1 glucokinase [Janthinobacterium agaricidamnosum NBRC 102515 = DSM 9628]
MSNLSPPVPSVSATKFEHGPRLLADVGGTNARFALEVAAGQIGLVEVLPCANYPTFTDALKAYLALPNIAAAGGQDVRHAAVAIANPVDGDFLQMTNHDWAFSIEAVRVDCGFETFVVVNDFTALARSLPALTCDQKRQVGGGLAREGDALGLLGAGTGLGVSGLIPSKNSWIALQSEGGHVTFAPSNEVEIKVLQFAWREFDHVSAERLISGVGLELIYRALADQAGVAAEPIPAAEITRRALAGESPLCDQAIEVFCEMLGTVAGNIAITLGALGGMYIGGGIVPRLGERFDRSGFRARFEQKGRFHKYMAQVPTYVITAQYPAFLGCSEILSEKLASA